MVNHTPDSLKSAWCVLINVHIYIIIISKNFVISRPTLRSQPHADIVQAFNPSRKEHLWFNSAREPACKAIFQFLRWPLTSDHLYGEVWYVSIEFLHVFVNTLGLSEEIHYSHPFYHFFLCPACKGERHQHLPESLFCAWHWMQMLIWERIQCR